MVCGGDRKPSDEGEGQRDQHRQSYPRRLVLLALSVDFYFSFISLKNLHLNKYAYI